MESKWSAVQKARETELDLALLAHARNGGWETRIEGDQVKRLGGGKEARQPCLFLALDNGGW